jgi:hypothetical protein
MKKIILSHSELSLAVEGRTTNLRIWKSKNDNTIFFRLDKFNAYSTPLSDESILYLDKPNDKINQLNKLFGFNRATINDIDTIIEIVKNMKIRDCLIW